MALFKKIKPAFGFSDSETEEEELEGIDARVTPLRRKAEDGDVADKSGSPSEARSEHHHGQTNKELEDTKLSADLKQNERLNSMN